MATDIHITVSSVSRATSTESQMTCRPCRLDGILEFGADAIDPPGSVFVQAVQAVEHTSLGRIALLHCFIELAQGNIKTLCLPR